jgi:hypothetical protein
MLGMDCAAVGRGRPEEETSDVAYYGEGYGYLHRLCLGGVPVLI